MSINPDRVGGWVRSTRDYFSTIKPLAKLIWEASPRLFVATLFMTLLTGLIPAANIFTISALLDTISSATQSGSSGSDPLQTVVLLLVLLASIYLVGGVLENVNNAIHELQGTRITNHVETLIAEKASAIDVAGFEDPNFHNRMRTAANEAPYRPKQIVDTLLNSVSSLTTLVSLSVALVLWHAWIVPVIFVASLATLGVSLYFGTAFVDLVNRRAEVERKKFYLGTLFISDQAVKEIRLFNLQNFLLTRFRDLLDTMYQQDRRLAVRQLFYSLFPGILLASVQTALIAFAALRALEGTITIGQFNLYTQSIVQVGSQVPSLMFAVAAVHESNLFAKGLFALLATQPQVEAPRPGSKDRTEKIRRTPRIEFRGVTFEYPGTGRTVLTNVTFNLDPGEAVALVGGNGAGKSTLVKLLSGLYEPTEGRILLDGVDIRGLDRADLREYLSVIFQDYVIYHLSARENIGVGKLDRLDEPGRLERASQRSGVDRVIAALPDGYETVLGRFWEQGHELSGGQRQLIALARALMRDAPIVILDEPSAALDIQTERRFFQRLLEEHEVEESRTVMFISHRFSTVRRADRILVLRDGRLTEEGTHEHLIAKNGYYSEMFKLQAAAYNSPSTSTGEVGMETEIKQRGELER